MRIHKRFLSSFKSNLSSTFLDLVSIHKLDTIANDACQIRPDLMESIPTTEAADINFLPSARILKHSSYTTPNIFTLRLKDVYFCPEYNLLHTKSRQIIEESLSTQKDLDQFDVRDFYFKKVSTISDICSTFRSHKNCYYHTLIDNLPRLYLLHHSNFQKINEIKVLLPSEPSSVEKFYLDKLLPKNAKIFSVDKNKLYKFENFIFPSFLSRRFSGYLPSEYRNWFLSKVAPSRPRKKVNRIFISRITTEKGKQRCILNEDELFRTLQPYGFKKYVLEHMTIEEQIVLFYDAEAVVAAHGAGLTNIIFSKNIKVLELFPMPFVVPHYYFLSKSLDHKYRYWCAQEKYKSSNFKVDTKAISNLVKTLNITP